MERKISFGDVQVAVTEAYEAYKSIKEGTVDSRIDVKDPKAFGISIVLTDGTVVNKGDTDVLSALGDITKIPTHVILLSQNSPEELVKKAGVCRCHGRKAEKPRIPVSAHGVRAVSAIVPQNDPDGKMDIIVSNIESLMAAAPVLDDKLYETLKKEVADANTIDTIAAADYTLYDQADIALDIYTKLVALQATAEQAATLGATIAADGRNPKNGQEVFDGKISANVTALVARGPHREGRAWMMEVGVPAKSSFGGLVLAIMPGFGAIAAYSPELDENGVSVKAAKAVKYIANKLQLNVYASARVEVVK